MKLPKINLRKLGASFRTRSFRVGSYSVAATLVVIAIAIAVNMLAGALPASLTLIDTTANQMFTLSQQTEQLVGGLEQEVTVYWIVRSGNEDSYLEPLLDKYASLGDKLKVVRKDPDVYPTFAQQYTDEVTENSFVVTCGDRYRYVDYNDIFVLDYMSYYYYGTEDWSFYGEQELTSAIDYVVRENLPKLYTLTGHGEGSLPDSFATGIDDENIETEELSLLTVEYVPTDADAVLINAPQSDISAEERGKLEEYLGNGGSLILITDPPQDGALTNLESLMAYYGMTAAEGIVIEGDQSYYAWERPYYLLPDINSHTITSPLIDGGYYVLLPIAQGLTVGSDLRESLSVTKLLTTSDDAFSKLSGYAMATYEKEEGDVDGPFVLAALATETIDDELYSNVVWISSAALLDEQADSLVSGGNQDFFLNIVSYLCEPEESSVSIRAKSLTTEYLTMDSATASSLTILMLGVLPLGYLAIGIGVWVWRKRR